MSSVERPNLSSNYDGIAAFMKVVEDIADPALRNQLAQGGRTSMIDDGVPSQLAAALNAMSEDELRFLARLKAHLDCVNFYDELGNPRLYYL
jgi:hypothetical protein